MTSMTYRCAACGKPVTVAHAAAWPSQCPHCKTAPPTLLMRVEPDYGAIDVPETPTTDEEIAKLPVLELDRESDAPWFGGGDDLDRLAQVEEERNELLAVLTKIAWVAPYGSEVYRMAKEAL